MNKGKPRGSNPVSTTELSDARVLRLAGAGWREIGDMLGRDFSGLRKLLDGLEPLNPTALQRRRKSKPPPPRRVAEFKPIGAWPADLDFRGK